MYFIGWGILAGDDFYSVIYFSFTKLGLVQSTNGLDPADIKSGRVRTKVRVEIDASVTTGCEALVFGVAIMPVFQYKTAV